LKGLQLILAFVAEAGLAPAEKAPATGGWKSVLWWVLTEEPCRGLAEAHYGELADTFLDLLGAPDPAIVSGVDTIGNALCRGWVVDRHNPSALLHVIVKLNGLSVKIVAADEFRRDIQARYGGDGRAGFTIRLDLLPGARQSAQPSIEIVELSQGVVVLPERLIELSHA